eukprot:TRINITY_DN769_c0_g1_i1.p1 TRINITY_DN769_c0_g1~~TRINITY_DN769_c0_g1_i1.p1  ORF type:complete len:362 (+),score=115.79 TRINITY_DN769_c0_g1_i1:119-1087(+)
MVIERLGKFDRVLESGLHFVVPLIERPRLFTWRKTSIGGDGKISDDTMMVDRIDLRESLFNFMEMEVYTKDTVLVNVNALMFYRIVDIRKAIYEVDDLLGALSNTAQTQIKEVFGNMNFNDALVSQSQINEHLVAEFSKLFGSWGIHVERMELLDLTPKGDTATVMKKQMIAERTRRADFIRSEGNKAAMRLKADGQKTVAVNLGLADQEARKKESEGEASARVEVARAESGALETVAEVILSEGGKQSQYMLAQRYMDLVRSVAASSTNQTVVLPYLVTELEGSVSSLENVYGSKAGTTPAAPAQPQTATRRAPAAFSALD